MFASTLGAPLMAVPASAATQVSADLTGSYEIAAHVSADLAGAYSVATQVNADLTGSYVINQLVAADMAGSYTVGSAVILVSADLAGSYSITGRVIADLAGSYGVIAHVSANLAGSYGIETNEVAMSYTKSVERTVTVSAGNKPFTAGTLWNMTDPKKPRSIKDPDATLDYSFDWTPWLLDAVDSVASHQIILGDGLTNAGSSLVGSVITVFVAGGTLETRAGVTCRVTTASVPPRIVDRTVYLDIEGS